MPLLVLVRHGQSTWNLENRFTGQTDVPLTAKGREEACVAGDKLRQLSFAHAFTSILVRAIDTLELILMRSDRKLCPVTMDKALNERNYGQLQGLDKAEVAEQYGEELVATWRRSFSVRPPGGESLADTAARVIPYYRREIEPLLKKGENILVVAHGNSLRALMMVLEKISEEDIAKIDLHTGCPREYRINSGGEVDDAVYL